MTLQRKGFHPFPGQLSRLALAFLFFAATSFHAQAAASCFSAPPGLVGWWPGDGAANDIASTNNGLLQGGATANAAGIDGQAFSFDGTNSFVQIPNAPALQPTNLTIEAWVLFNSLNSTGSGGSPAGDQYIVFMQNTQSGDFEGFDLSKTRVGSNDVFRFLISSATALKAEVHSVTTISTNTWYYVAAVRGSNFMQLYVNGVLEQQTNIAFVQSYGNFPLYFGTSGESFWDHKLSGSLDEVSLYNRALSSAEIASIYTAGSSGKCKAPNITTQPQPATATAGSNFTFTVAATGLGPLGYQWQFNGTNLPGANATSLFLTNVQSSQAGNYSVVVTNSLGSATSSVAALTINLAPSCTTPPSGLVGWWTGDNTTFDSASTNNGTLVGGVTYGPGRIGQAFAFNAALEGVPVGNPASLQLQNFTIAAWIKRASSTIATSSSVTTALIFGYGSGGYGLGIDNSGRLFLTRVDIDNVTINTSLTDTNYHHVAVAKSGTTVIFYIDGVAYPGAPYSTTYSFSTPAAIGTRADDFDASFFGSIDDVAVFNRPLAAGEIQSIYNAGGAGMCAQPPNIVSQPSSQTLATGSNALFSVTATGSQPVNYQWFYNGAPLADGGRISGSMSNLLTIANLFTNDSGNYFAIASNSAGLATSIVAGLTVFMPPSFVIQPTNETWIAGSNATLVSLATGSQPITYQWYQNGVELMDNGHFTGTATSTLSISNVQTIDAGTYFAVASNFGSSTVSTGAVITVVVPPAITTQPRGWSIPLGFPVTFAGAASGTAPAGYQWLLNGSPVPLAAGPTLTISNTVASNYGNYQLVATNAGGAVTSSVTPLTLGNVGTWGTFTQVANFPIWPPPGLSNAVAVAAGGNFSLALRGDGTVVEWSNNTSVTNIPTNLTGIVGIAAGLNHALALRSDGTVIAWGQNTFGQTNVPPGLSNVIAVSAGVSHSAALKSDGTVTVWGFSTRELQTNIPPGLFTVKAIDAGGSQTIALREDGTAVSWGGSTPLPVPAGLGPLMGVAAGQLTSTVSPFAMAVGSNGLVSVWAAQTGVIGAPTNVPPGLTGVAAVDAGGGVEYNGYFAMAMRSNGTVAVWTAPFAGAAFPITNLPPGVSNTVAISAGQSHALALFDDGRPLIIGPPVGGTFYSGRDLVLKAKAVGTAPLTYLWLKDGNPVSGGTNVTLDVPSAQFTDAGNYQLIVSNIVGVTQSFPVPVTIVDSRPVLDTQPQSGFAYYGSPFSVGAALIGSGPLTMQWLQNGLPGASGTNNLVFNRALPQQAGTYQFIASNPFGSVTSSVAQITFSRVATWGTGPALTNAPVNLGTVTAVAMGFTHALALNADGTVSAWATNANTATNVPPGLSNVIAIAAGNGISVALKGDGTVSAWGSSLLGNGPPPGLSNVIAVAAGGGQELALLSNGTVVGWGVNSAVTPPAGLSNVVAIAAGSTQSLALKSDGTIVGWGQFGKIPPTTNVVAISAGYLQSLALQADGTVVGWSTGGGTTLLPANLNNVVAISAGGGSLQQFFSVALKSDGSIVAWGQNGGGELNVPAGILSTVALSAGSGSTFAYLNDRSPFVATQPFDRHIASGTNVTLAALAVGQPSLDYQWLFKGTNIPGANAPTLSLTGVNRASRGDYYAMVWNGLGTNNSRDMQLAVGGPVRLLQPTVTGAGGSGGSFSVLLQDSFGGTLTLGDLTSFTVLTSSNLVDWLPLAGTLTYTNGAFLFQDPGTPNQPQRFYQVVEP